MPMKPKLLYGGYYLSAMSTPTDSGGFQSRVAIMVLSSERTRSQRFLDFDCHETEGEANLRAIEGGKEWIDAQLRREVFRSPTNFAAL
jgi:hypothetical protein